MQRPPFETFKKATCRGSYALGTVIAVLIAATYFAQTAKKPMRKPKLVDKSSVLTKVVDDCYGDYGAGNSNGEYYTCVGGKWVLDQKMTEEMRSQELDREKHRTDLVSALVTRVLTEQEWNEVVQTGPELMQPYSGSWHFGDEDRNRKPFYEAVLQQLRIRAISKPCVSLDFNRQERRTNSHNRTEARTKLPPAEIVKMEMK